MGFTLAGCPPGNYWYRIKYVSIPRKPFLFYIAGSDKRRAAGQATGYAIRVTGGPRTETMDVQNSWGMPKRCIQQKAAWVDLREAQGLHVTAGSSP